MRDAAVSMVSSPAMAPRSRSWLGLVAALTLCGGCATTKTAQAAADHDRPVPPDVPRNEVRLTVDLEPAQDCEERFDLALYRDRGIDLITWDDGVGSCVGRTVTIRFLPNAIDRQQVLDKVKGLTRRMASGGAADDRS